MNLEDQSSARARGVLYLVVCAAPSARDVYVLVDLAEKAGWDTCVVATPRAFQWIDAPGLSERTGHPVRYDYKLPGEPDLLPPPDAIIVAPATSNTINKWAAGISDTLALGLLCEAIGMELPVVVLPYLNAAQGKHPALAASIQRLRGCGVQVLFGPDVLPLHRPREGRREPVPMAPDPGGAGRLLMRVARLPGQEPGPCTKASEVAGTGEPLRTPVGVTKQPYGRALDDPGMTKPWPLLRCPPLRLPLCSPVPSAAARPSLSASASSRAARANPDFLRASKDGLTAVPTGVSAGRCRPSGAK